MRPLIQYGIDTFNLKDVDIRRVKAPEGNCLKDSLGLFRRIHSTEFNMNNLFFNGQHSFRAFHSCESALHELISFLNKTKNKKLIALLLFIDFK